MNDDESVPLVDVLYARRYFEAGLPEGHDGPTSDAIAFVAWNGYVDAASMTVTESGRSLLGKVGFMVPAIEVS